MRAPATTFECVEALALREPRRPAIGEQGHVLGYGQLHGMLLQCGLALQRLGVQRGDRVAVAGPGFALQLVVLLAAEALGAVTTSFLADEDPDAPFLFGQVQWVLAGRPQAVPAGVGFQLLDDAFARQLAAPPGEETPAWSALALDEPQRISRTSGSTGQSKFMVLRRHAQEQWIRTGLDAHGNGVPPRLLVLGPFVINAAFTRCSACLRNGGMLLVGPGSAIAQMAPTSIWGLPLHLERLLAELPEGWRPSQPVALYTFGGTVSAALRERAQAVFGGRIANRYGSNEASSICDDLDAAGSGVLTAGVDLRILDAHGQEVPAGQDGIVVVRTPAMADGYLGRPEETAAAFRDGWFHTGDVGALVGRRRLRLAGRHDDLVNIGGLKVPAARIESDLRRQPAIADAAVQTVQLEGGAVTLAVALVLAPGASREGATAQLQAALQLPHDQAVRLRLLTELPRLPGGKVDRMALLRLLQQSG